MASPATPSDMRKDELSGLASRVLLEWLLTAVISIAIVLVLVFSNLTQRTDHLFYDTLSQLDAPAASDDIIIVAIDDRSLEALGPWPWSRDIHARLIDALSAANTGPVGYDVLFLEETPEDAALANAIAKAGNVYLPTLLSAPGMNGQAYSLTSPPTALAQAVAGTGHVMLTPDEDGTTRHLPLWLIADDNRIGHLSLPLARHLMGTDRFAVPTDTASNALITHLPVLIRYPDINSGYRQLSAVDVINGEVPPEFLSGRVVLVGATAHGMGDRYSTTNNHDYNLTPGVEIQAALLQTLSQDTAPYPVGKLVQALLSLIPLAIMLVGLLLLRPTANTILGISLLVVTLAASALALHLGTWWPPMGAIYGLLIVWPLWSWRRLAATYRYMQGELSSLQSHLRTAPLSKLSVAPKWGRGDQISRQAHDFSSALKQLQDFNRFINQSVHSLPDAAVVSDTHGKVLIANARANDLFSNIDLKDSTLASLFASVGLKDWKPLLEASSHQRDDLLLQDGRALQIATSGLIDTDGQLAGHIIRFADVTQLRASERQRERTLQLLGHDMRAPQVSILTLLDNPKRSPDFEKRIRANAQQTLSLADGYVQLSRAESQHLRFDLTDLGHLLTEAVDLMWPQAAAKGVILNSPEEDQEYLINADSSLLRRVIINLLDNAIRHTNSGGFVRCGLMHLDTDILMIIADEGPGFPEDAKAQMFTPFQGGNIAGSGLGLAFVHTVVQRHGGQISLDPPHGVTPPSKGACFYILLPSAELDME